MPSKLNCSLNNTEELREMILGNPELPLMVFCGECCNTGLCGYEQASVSSVKIEELVLYTAICGDIWLTKEDYTETLSDDLSDKKEYETLSDEDYDKIIEKKVEQTEFVKAIVLWVDN